MRLEIIRGFLSVDECNELNRWADMAVANNWIGYGNTSLLKPQKTRYTSRMYGDRYVYPDIVREISQRARRSFGIEHTPLIEGHGRDGVVFSYTLDGGDTFEHQDHNGPDGLSTLRFNVMTQKPKSGGILHIEGKPVPLEVGDLHCYLVSDHLHYVDQTIGDTPRILWMFGAHVMADDWNSGRIKFGLS